MQQLLLILDSINFSYLGVTQNRIKFDKYM